MSNFSVICPGIAFKTEYIATDEEYQSLVDSQAEHRFYLCSGNFEDGFILFLNHEALQQLCADYYPDSGLTAEYLEDGCIISNLARLRYEKQLRYSVTSAQKYLVWGKDDVLFNAVYDALTTFFAEYFLTREFPQYGRILAVYNRALAQFFKPARRLEELHRKYLDGLQSFFYYNRMLPYLPKTYYAFMVPLCLSAIRTTVEHVVKVSYLLTIWIRGLQTLQYDVEQEEMELPEIVAGQVETGDVATASDDEVYEVLRKESVRYVKTKMHNSGSSTGFRAGVGNYVSKVNGTTQFFLDTVQKYYRHIAELEYIFKQCFTSIKLLPSFDGDVNLLKQQEAYLASKTMEELKVYNYYLRKKVLVDIVIMRDISGSTYRFEREYAEAIVIILAAVNSFEGIRTAVIDFSGNATVKKNFSDKVEHSLILPVSGGGTNMLPAVRLLEEQKFKGRRRLLFILSDGEINDRKQAEAELADFCKTNGIEIAKITFDKEDNHGYQHVSITNLPVFIAKGILGQGGV